MEKRSRNEAEEDEEASISISISRTTRATSLVECGELVLPWLDHRELASISSTCRALSRISTSISAIRSSDATRSFEQNNPIPFIHLRDPSLTDHHHPPPRYSYFLYTPSQTLAPDPSLRQPWGTPSSNQSGAARPPHPYRELRVVSDDDASSTSCGCDCDENENESGSGRCCDVGGGCPCSSSSLALECGPSCRCQLLEEEESCRNRATQRGVLVRLKIVMMEDRRKGWGLHAAHSIQLGQFVCEYAGELLTTKEARRRQQIYDDLASSGGRFSSALLVVREHLPSGNACMRMNIDATRIGNVARFINHSCDGGNLSTVLVRSSGALLPRLCFFASRDIEEDEELSFSYGDIVRLRPKGLQCFCGSSGCRGMLPSEHT